MPFALAGNKDNLPLTTNATDHKMALPTPRRLTILICTHNRAGLLQQVLNSINEAQRPASWHIDILVAANACTDGTYDLLRAYPTASPDRTPLPLVWFEEPTPGKSFALNSALARIDADLVFFEDDDQRVANDFLIRACEVAERQAEVSIFCGRLLPDWTGKEPEWVHLSNAYRIYPAPVPVYDLGMQAHTLDEEEDLPTGGNLVLRAPLIRKLGLFSTDLGPRGHNLGGGEDNAYIKKAIAMGERIFYEPRLLQYHYVDPQRLKLGFLMRLANQRTFAVMRMGEPIRFIPRYVWRKLATHLAHSLLTFRADKRRFHLVRAAATLGEIRGFWARVGRGSGQDAR